MGEWTLRYQWTDYAPAFLDFQHTAKDPKELANRLANLYFGDYTSRTVPSSRIAQVRPFFSPKYMFISFNQMFSFRFSSLPIDTSSMEYTKLSLSIPS